MRIAPDKIVKIIESLGFECRNRQNTIHAQCPACDEAEVSISKRWNSGATICYRAKCTFGRQWFEDWIAQTTGISRQDAIRLIEQFDVPQIPENYRIDDDETSGKVDKQQILQEVPWPAKDCFPLEFPECSQGHRYLIGRGIPVEVAKKYGIMYNLVTDRVVIPIVQDGVCLGWQARATYDVNKKYRMMNNEGYSRGMTLMFHDNLLGSEHAVICEGPFDAMKFDKVGGNVSTMGASVTDDQIQLIIDSGVKKVYLAMDMDNAGDQSTTSIIDRLGLVKFQIYKVSLPQSCVARCDAKGSKADFGECTFEECEEAIRSATAVDQYVIL